jgi:hypothetical protein
MDPELMPQINDSVEWSAEITAERRPTQRSK